MEPRSEAGVDVLDGGMGWREDSNGNATRAGGVRGVNGGVNGEGGLCGQAGIRVSRVQMYVRRYVQ